MEDLINVKFPVNSRKEASKATQENILKLFKKLQKKQEYLTAPTCAKVEIEEVQYSATSEEDFLDSVEKVLKRYRRGA